MLRKELGKNNNAGFTLLEVLIAIIILAIISVPLLRAFASAAQTNRRAKVESLCTNAAENVAESFRDIDADELVEMYVGREFENSDYNATLGKYLYEVVDSSDPNYGNIAELDTATGVYTYTIKNQNTMNSGMPDNYYCQVTLDPSLYKNANGLNLAQIEPVSIKDSAIFTMPDDFDDGAYTMFVDRNKVLDHSAYTQHDKAWFKENLTRTITFDIDSTGSVKVDSEGNLVAEDDDTVEDAKRIDICTVKMTVEYSLDIDNKLSVLPESQCSLVYTTAYLFDNSTNRRELNSVYLFFYPRYLAGTKKRETMSQPGRDRIVVNNEKNIKCNLYLTILKGAEDENLMPSYCLASSPALGVSIVETPDFSVEEKGAITLRTNLNNGVPYNKQDKVDHPDKGKLYMLLSYGNRVKSIMKYGEDAGKILSVGNTDGKALNVEDTPNRIYSMKVEVFDPNAATVITDPVTGAPVTVNNAIVEFNGTKLEY